MITGKINSLSCYKGINKRIDTAIDYILNFDKNTPDGRYEIDGDNIYANVVSIELGDAEAYQFEAHRRYLDLQYIISGSEIMIYAPVSECNQKTDYNAEDDYLLLSGRGNKMKMTEGSFYLVHPFDAHAPGLKADCDVARKIIVKIKL